MIGETSVILIVTGKFFSPLQAEERLGLVFSEKHQPGDVGRRGRFKDIPMPYGSATLESDISGDSATLVPHDFVLFQDARFMDTLRECGASHFALYINIGFIDQCNFEIDPSTLANLAALDITTAFSCYPMPLPSEG